MSGSHAHQASGSYVEKVLMGLIGVPQGLSRLPFLAPTKEVVTNLTADVRAWCASLDDDLKPMWCAKIAAAA